MDLKTISTKELLAEVEKRNALHEKLKETEFSRKKMELCLYYLSTNLKIKLYAGVAPKIAPNNHGMIPRLLYDWILNEIERMYNEGDLKHIIEAKIRPMLQEQYDEASKFLEDNKKAGDR